VDKPDSSLLESSHIAQDSKRPVLAEGTTGIQLDKDSSLSSEELASLQPLGAGFIDTEMCVGLEAPQGVSNLRTCSSGGVEEQTASRGSGR
jgi:hypothetical protein